VISDEFAPLLLRTFADPAEHGVHLLVNEWWQHAPDDVKDAVLHDLDVVRARVGVTASVR
jgi:hypothetical protein